jgi:hypothetical protein
VVEENVVDVVGFTGQFKQQQLRVGQFVAPVPQTPQLTPQLLTHMPRLHL